MHKHKNNLEVIITSTTIRTFIHEYKDKGILEDSNKLGYCSRISCSVSQVASFNNPMLLLDFNHKYSSGATLSNFFG